MSDTNQVPHSGPTTVSRHRTKFSRPGHLARCIYVPLVSALRVQVWCHLALPHCSLLDTKQVCGKFIAVMWKTALRSCVFGCSFLPAFRNYTSQQLPVHLRRIFLQEPLQYCSVFRLHCVLCDVAGTRWQRCAIVGVQQGAGAAEGSKRTAVAVCSRCLLDTSRTQKIAHRLKTRYSYVQFYF